VPDLRSGRRGDQIVRLNIVVPKGLTDEQKQLLKDLAHSLGTDVRPQEEKGFIDALKDAFRG
jgi:molecular chaperone DnaJ